MADERFSRSQRLLIASQFQHVFDNPVRSRDSFFTVLGRPSGQPTARLGLAVSRKTDKRAVMRNRLKRLIRESFRRQRLPALDVVVITKPAAARAARTELTTSLEQHWQRLINPRRQRSSNRRGSVGKPTHG
ncbi:MAG: ribonuclease P protein component [Pseudomonadota bacterium]